MAEHRSESEIEDHLVDDNDEMLRKKRYSKRLPPGFMVDKFKDDFLVAKAYYLSEFCKKIVHGHNQEIHYRGEDEIMQGLDDYLIQDEEGFKMIQDFFITNPQYTWHLSEKYKRERNEVHQFVRTLRHMDNENLHSVVKAYARVLCKQGTPIQARDVLREAIVFTLSETHDPWDKEVFEWMHAHELYHPLHLALLKMGCNVVALMIVQTLKTALGVPFVRLDTITTAPPADSASHAQEQTPSPQRQGLNLKAIANHVLPA